MDYLTPARTKQELAPATAGMDDHEESHAENSHSREGKKQEDSSELTKCLTTGADQPSLWAVTSLGIESI